MILTRARYTVTTTPELQVGELLRGRTALDAAETLPRLFNLCRGAQELGARLALGLPTTPDLLQTAHEEAIRDHVLKLFIALPSRLDVGSPTLPQGWQSDAAAVVHAGFGPNGVPLRLADFRAFLNGGLGLAPLLNAIQTRFANRMADTGPVPLVSVDTMFKKAPVENSVAGRHADHPIMAQIAESYGHGPLWRTMGRVIDLTRPYPAPRRTAFGTIVSAPRGDYGLRIGTSNGHVTDLTRITPTDHLLARGGILDRSLATLTDSGLAPLLLDILDPCIPVTVQEADHA